MSACDATTVISIVLYGWLVVEASMSRCLTVKVSCSNSRLTSEVAHCSILQPSFVGYLRLLDGA